MFQLRFIVWDPLTMETKLNCPKQLKWFSLKNKKTATSSSEDQSMDWSFFIDCFVRNQ